MNRRFPTRRARRSPKDFSGLLAAQIRAVGMMAPQREVRFHPVRKWRFDLAWPELKVAVEVHGAVFSGGRHTRGDGFTKDREKINAASLLGWRVFEVTTKWVQSGQALEVVKEALGHAVAELDGFT